MAKQEIREWETPDEAVWHDPEPERSDEALRPTAPDVHLWMRLADREALEHSYLSE